MSWDIAKGNLTLLKGTIKLHWGKLTNNKLRILGGKHDQLVGSIHKIYGTTKRTIDERIRKFVGPRQQQDRRI